MQINKTDANDAEGLAHIMRTGWFRAVHVKSLPAHGVRALLDQRRFTRGTPLTPPPAIRQRLRVVGLSEVAGDVGVGHAHCCPAGEQSAVLERLVTTADIDRA
jgi:transposase